MDELLTVLKVSAILTGFITPILCRRALDGPFLSKGWIVEGVGFVLAWMVTNPVALLVTLALSTYLPFSQITGYAYLTALNIVLGIVGGWVWKTFFLRPMKRVPKQP